MIKQAKITLSTSLPVDRIQHPYFAVLTHTVHTLRNRQNYKSLAFDRQREQHKRKRRELSSK